MDINQLIQKVPRPVLVVGIMVLAIVLFVYNDPLKDECEVQASIFEKKMQGLITSVRTKTKKTQFAKIDYWRDRCKEGNSIGSCSDYFEGLRLFTQELRNMNDNCQIKYSIDNDRFIAKITEGIQIMALVAWGEKPPVGLADRLGWLNESNARTYCYLKKTLLLVGEEESFNILRQKVYREYPGEWPEKFINKLVESNVVKDKQNDTADVDIAKLVAENRPRAFKTQANPSGTLDEKQIYERSLFSLKCDLYM